MPDDIKASNQIPDDLKLKLSTIKMVASLHDILNKGSFEGFLSERVHAGIKFVESLHAQMVAEAKAHECAHLVEGLKEEISQ